MQPRVRSRALRWSSRIESSAKTATDCPSKRMIFTRCVFCLRYEARSTPTRCAGSSRTVERNTAQGMRREEEESSGRIRRGRWAHNSRSTGAEQFLWRVENPPYCRSFCRLAAGCSGRGGDEKASEGASVFRALATLHKLGDPPPPRLTTPQRSTPERCHSLQPSTRPALVT